MSDTRHHMLRQGRGAGFIAALTGGPAVVAELIDCVVHDPRWDKQVDSRCDYYARLLLAVGADLTLLGDPLELVGRDSLPSDLWLKRGVLERIGVLTCPRAEVPEDSMALKNQGKTEEPMRTDASSPTSAAATVRNQRVADAREAKELLRLRGRVDGQSRQIMTTAAHSGTLEQKLVAFGLLGELDDPCMLELVIDHLTVEYGRVKASATHLQPPSPAFKQWPQTTSRAKRFVRPRGPHWRDWGCPRAESKWARPCQMRSSSFALGEGHLRSG